MRRRSSIAVIFLLLLAAGLWLWEPWQPSATLKISEIHQRDGKNYATVVLENPSPRPIFYEGAEGTPQCHFSERTPAGVITDSGPHVVRTASRKPPELGAGERAVFEVQLKLGSRARPIADPFTIGVKLSNSPAGPTHNPARTIPIIGRWLPTGEHILWSAESQLK